MNSYFHVNSIAKMMTARSDNGITAIIYPHFFENDTTKVVRLSKIVMSAEIKLMLLVFIN